MNPYKIPGFQGILNELAWTEGHLADEYSFFGFFQESRWQLRKTLCEIGRRIGCELKE